MTVEGNEVHKDTSRFLGTSQKFSKISLFPMNSCDTKWQDFLHHLMNFYICENITLCRSLTLNPNTTDLKRERLDVNHLICVMQNKAVDRAPYRYQ